MFQAEGVRGLGDGNGEVVGNEAPGQIRIFVVKGQEFGFILSVMGVWGKVAGDASAGNGLI